MKPKTIVGIVLLGFAVVSVAYLVVKEVRPGEAAAPPAWTAAPTAPGPPVATVAVAPTGATAAPPPKGDNKVVTVFWFYDNSH